MEGKGKGPPLPMYPMSLIEMAKGMGKMPMDLVKGTGKGKGVWYKGFGKADVDAQFQKLQNEWAERLISEEKFCDAVAILGEGERVPFIRAHLANLSETFVQPCMAISKKIARGRSNSKTSVSKPLM